MKIALAQINPKIGSFNENFKKAASYIEEAKKQGANLVIFPELSLLGYPPKDLILKNGLIEKQTEVIEELCKFSDEEFGIIVGGLAENRKFGKKFYNSLYCLRAGKIELVSHKMLLPTYDVFDETRYFQPASKVKIWDFMGKKIGLSICEDIWIEAYTNLYNRNPINELVASGAELIVNASASPYSLGKPELRDQLMTKLVKQYKLPLVYINQVGANDQLIFDGASKAYASNGSAASELKRFSEELKLVSLEDLSRHCEEHRDAAIQSKQDMDRHATLAMTETELQNIHDALCLGIKDYVQKCGFSQVILGLSGGIDSALVAVLAKEALGAENVFAYMLPTEFTSDSSFQDAKKLAENIGINYEIIEIKNLHKEIRNLIPDLSPLADENVQPRLRANILMAQANTKNAMLLATGNKSEIAVGYSTLYGDSCGALAPIGDLLKTQVYKLCEFTNRDSEIIPKNIIEKAPSAELRHDQKDSDSLPDYEELDKIIMLYVQELWSKDQIIKTGFEEATVKKVLNLIDRAEYKRQQAPPILKIAGKAFGEGRRMPIAQGYQN